MNNQCERILDYIERFGSITPLDAHKDLSVMRLSARVHDLRSQGHNVQRKMETRKNRFGEPTTYARYYLDKGAIDHES